MLAPEEIARAIPRAQVRGDAHPFAAPVAFGLAYLACALLALPGVWILGLAAGAISGMLRVPPDRGSSAVAATLRCCRREALLFATGSRRYPNVVARLDRGGARFLFAARSRRFFPTPSSIWPPD